MVNFACDLSLVGKVLDERYEVLEPLGGGGVGSVYRARRLKLERIVAVKVLHESLVTDGALVRRFQLEAVAMSRLHHPHCLSVIDFGVHQGRPYLVLEYVPGNTVKQLLEHGPFTATRAVNIALQLLDTLEYFHGHHVIHRDLKSENVMLVESSGEADFVKVLDFGMAKVLTGPGADSQLSKMGFVPGTPSAMAPEQIRQIPPDPRLDIYATGILLYEMIVGSRPFSGPDQASVIKMQLTAAPRPPRELVGDDVLSVELEQVILKALEKDRLDRFANALQMAIALRNTPEGRPRSMRLAMRARSGRMRRRVFAALGGVTVVGLAAAAFVGLRQRDRPPPVAVVAPVAAPAPVRAVDAPVPAPAPVLETWVAHRDLAITYRDRGQAEDAAREVQAALTDKPGAAAADPSLVEVAVDTLSAERAPLVAQAFRDNPGLVDALAEAAARGATRDQRHAAVAALHELGREDRTDPVATALLDLQQAPNCRAQRLAFKSLRGSRDPRVAEFSAQLRARGSSDPLAKCLGKMGPPAKRPAKRRTTRATAR